jgi:hypothetical protein
MLVCSSPQLIAAYHVLLRLLEPRHPPCALICFKTIQIFYGVLPPFMIWKDQKITRCYNFFSQYVKELFPITRDSLMSWLRSTRPWSLPCQHHFILKELEQLRLLSRLRIASDPLLNNSLRIGSQTTLRRAIVFERPPVVRGGGYRSRTDDPLLAKQVL